MFFVLFSVGGWVLFISILFIFYLFILFYFFFVYACVLLSFSLWRCEDFLILVQSLEETHFKECQYFFKTGALNLSTFFCARLFVGEETKILFSCFFFFCLFVFWVNVLSQPVTLMTVSSINWGPRFTHWKGSHKLILL